MPSRIFPVGVIDRLRRKRVSSMFPPNWVGEVDEDVRWSSPQAGP